MKPIRIGQIGVGHEHASGIMQALLRLPEHFEVVGVVEEENPRWRSSTAYEGLPRMTEEELFTTPGLEAVAVETNMPQLAQTALRCMERGLHMHLDKPGGQALEPFARLLDGMDDAVATGHFHVSHRHRPNRIAGEDGGEFLDVRGDLIELGARHGHASAREQLLVEVRHGDRNAVGGDQHVSIFPHVAGRRDERELNRPVRQLRTLRRLLRSQRTGHRSGALERLLRRRLLGGASGLDGGFVELVSLALFNSYRIERAGSQAGAQPVAEILGQQFGLAVDNLDRAFGTIRNTQTAAGAFVFVNPDDLSRYFAAHTGLHELGSLPVR